MTKNKKETKKESVEQISKKNKEAERNETGGRRRRWENTGKKREREMELREKLMSD